MPAERRKLARLKRLVGIRAVARQAAASDAGLAESTLAQLRELGARSEGLASGYARRTDAGDGSDLRRLAMFATGLETVRRRTAADTARAQIAADLRQSELAVAERRRAATQDRLEAITRSIAASVQHPVLSARRK